MKGISWGNLPRYFFKEYRTGLSINAVALGCGVEMMRQEFPPLPCIKQIALPAGNSNDFLNGFSRMRQIICEEESENNPMSFLTKAIYNSVCCHNITETEFFFQYKELQNELSNDLFCFHNIKYPKTSCNYHTVNDDMHKLFIIIESRNTMQEHNRLSLYTLKQDMQRSNQPHITITVPDSDEYCIGILYALLAATDAMLEHIFTKNQDTDDIK